MTLRGAGIDNECRGGNGTAGKFRDPAVHALSGWSSDTALSGQASRYGIAGWEDWHERQGVRSQAAFGGEMRILSTSIAVMSAAMTLQGCANMGPPDAASAVDELELSESLAPAPRRDPPIEGTVWHGIGGEHGNVPTRWELVGVDANEYTFEDSGGCVWTLTSKYDGTYLFTDSIEWKDCSSTDGFRKIKGKEGTLWPLEVGNTVEYEATGHSGGKWDGNWRCEVTDEVRVQVEAGAFDTYKVVCGSLWKTEVHYYAPEIESNVRYVRTPKNQSSVTRADWQLKRIERPDSQ